jgi:hypothetical protein
MFNVVLSIRNNDISDLINNLKNAVNSIEQDWSGIESFRMHDQNKKFVKHLFCRITAYLDSLIGKDSTYSTYKTPRGKPYEIEHIWADKFEEHQDEFEQENDFIRWRNSMGALLLLPKGTNQSFGSDDYSEKLTHYYRENTFAQTLNPSFYESNPNFLNNSVVRLLRFEPHPNFKKDDILKRRDLVKRICEHLWSLDNFDEHGNST